MGQIMEPRLFWAVPLPPNRTIKLAGNYRLLRLERIAQRPLPPVEVVDMAGVKRRT